MDASELINPSGMIIQPNPNPFDSRSVMTLTHSATTY
jgi:hypothetical protein